MAVQADPHKPVPHAERDRVALRCHTALAAFLAGEGTDREWADMADAINHVNALLDMGKLPKEPWVKILADAMAGMVQGRHSFVATGVMEAGPEYHAALRECVNEYDRAIGRFSAWTIAQAGSWVVVKIAGNRDVVVCD